MVPLLKQRCVSALLLAPALLLAVPGAAQDSDDDSSTEAADEAAPGKPRLLVMEFQAESVDKATLASIEDLASDAFARTDRFDVLTGSDLAELMQLEGEKQAVGCTDSDCLAEIAGALGAEYVLTGRLSRLGSLYVLKLSLLQPSKARTVGTETFEVDSVEDLATKLRPVGARLTADAFGEQPPRAERPNRRERRERRSSRRDDEDLPAEEEEGSVLASTLLWGGAAGCGGGALLFLLGGAGTIGAFAVLQQATLGGGVKGVTRVGGDIALIGLPVGILVALISGALLVTGLALD